MIKMNKYVEEFTKLYIYYHTKNMTRCFGNNCAVLNAGEVRLSRNGGFVL